MSLGAKIFRMRVSTSCQYRDFIVAKEIIRQLCISASFCIGILAIIPNSVQRNSCSSKTLITQILDIVQTYLLVFVIE
jgi:hypothetical protein